MYGEVFVNGTKSRLPYGPMLQLVTEMMGRRKLKKEMGMRMLTLVMRCQKVPSHQLKLRNMMVGMVVIMGLRMVSPVLRSAVQAVRGCVALLVVTVIGALKAML